MLPVAYRALLLAVLVAPAAARERPDRSQSQAARPFTPSLTCAAVRDIVARRGHVVLATSPIAYETVHLDSGACQQDVTGAPAFEPTLDDPNCFAGYRCRQRMNDGTGGAR